MNENFMKIPCCIKPWQHFGIGWNTFGTCCNAFSLDFGNVKEIIFNNENDVKEKIFNHDNYIFMREKLGGGGIFPIIVKYVTKCVMRALFINIMHGYWICLLK